MASERQDDNEISPWWGEHLHRYEAALQYLQKNDDVLDIACGTGFGTHLLSTHTNGLVTGADISEEAIAYCRKKFHQQKNLQFELIDGTRMPFEEHRFNMITSFETIEHTTRYMEMLREFRRTIKPGGIVIISTPNFVVNSPAGKVNNPFHTQEFNYQELKNILEEVFDDVKMMGQKYVRYDKKGLRSKTGKLTENILYKRGIRKIPISVQNLLMKLMGGTTMYPVVKDFALTEKTDEILNCKTFVAICKKI